MYLDALTTLSTNQAVTVTAPSTNVYDTAGTGVGQAPGEIFGVQPAGSAVFGRDIGGGGPLADAPQLAVIIGTAFTAVGSATMQVQLQAAIDDGTNNPGTWDTIIETDTIAKALLTAGQTIANFTVPKRYPGQGFPRFYRLNYVVATGPMTAGTISYAGLLTGVDDLPAYPSGF